LKLGSRTNTEGKAFQYDFAFYILDKKNIFLHNLNILMFLVTCRSSINIQTVNTNKLWFQYPIASETDISSKIYQS